MKRDANGTQKGPGRQRDCLPSFGCMQTVPTPGTGTPEVSAVPHDARQGEEATRTEQLLLGDCSEHLKQNRWIHTMPSFDTKNEQPKSSSKKSSQMDSENADTLTKPELKKKYRMVMK